MSRAGFEPTITVFERWKRVSDRATIGSGFDPLLKFWTDWANAPIRVSYIQNYVRIFLDIIIIIIIIIHSRI
jgi:hypothetical protein